MSDADNEVWFAASHIPNYGCGFAPEPCEFAAPIGGDGYDGQPIDVPGLPAGSVWRFRNFRIYTGDDFTALRVKQDEIMGL